MATHSLVDQADRDAKKYFIETFFDDLDGKVRFVEELYSQGRRDEAIMLCCVYLDGLGNFLSGSSAGSAENFCRVLIDHSREEVFGFILPHRLAERVPWKSAPTGGHGALDPALRALPKLEAFVESELVATLTTKVPESTLRWLERHLWRGSVANLVGAASGA